MSLGRRVGVVALLVAAGCGKSSGDGATASSASAVASAAPPAKGLAAPGNDAAIVAAAKKTLACPWKSDGMSFDVNCADWKTWTTTSEVFTSAGADSTFINMVEDPDVKVRVLAAYHLGYDSERKWVTDAALAKRVIAAAAAETQSHYELDAHGKALAKIQYAKTNLWPDAKAALEGTQLKTLLRTALDFLLDYNETNADVWSWVKSKTKDSDKSVAEWAVYGFSGLPSRKQDACKVFTDLLSDDRVGGDCAAAIALQSNDCATHLDAMLDATEARAKAGNAADVDWAIAMERTAQNVKTSEPQKKRALKVLAELVNNTHLDGWMRGASLRDLADVALPSAKSLAGKYVKDKDTSLQSAAKDVLAKK